MVHMREGTREHETLVFSPPYSDFVPVNETHPCLDRERNNDVHPDADATAQIGSPLRLVKTSER